MIKKNKKKTLLALGIGLTTASTIALPALLLGSNQDFLNLKNKNNKIYEDSSWINIPISTIGYSPVNWINTKVLPVSYEGKPISNVLDVYNYSADPANITKFSTIFAPGGSGFEVNLFSDPLYTAKINNGVLEASNFINLQASKIDINSLTSGTVVYQDMISGIGVTSGANAIWDKRQTTTTTANDRIVKVLMRKAFGMNDPFANKAYGSEAPQGLTYITQGSTNADRGTMPRFYNETGHGTSINPNTDSLIRMEQISKSTQGYALMVLDLIAYMDVNNTWSILPNFTNTLNPGAPKVSNFTIDQTQFDKTLSPKLALEKAISEKKKILNITSTNAPKFWDETSTITAQYDNKAGKIKISISINQTIDETKKYDSNIISDSKKLSETEFKTGASQNPNDGSKLIKNPNQSFTYEISGFVRDFDTDSILIEKSKSNKNILPSAIVNNPATLETYVDVYQYDSINNTLPANVELTISAQDDSLGQAIFSIYDKTTKKVLTSIIIKGFKTSNIARPLTNPVNLIDDKTFGGNYATAAAKPYDASAFIPANNPTRFSTQALLNQILSNHMMIRPISIPFGNSFLIASGGIPGKTYSNNNFLLLVSPQGEIISQGFFWQALHKISLIDLTYDSNNNQVISWFLDGLTLKASITLLDPNTGLLTAGSTFEITTHNGGFFTKQNLAVNLAIVPVPNINKTEYWIVNRALQNNNVLTSDHPSLNADIEAAQFLTRVSFNGQNTAPIVKWWIDDFENKIKTALLDKDISIAPNPGTATAKFTSVSRYKFHNISSNFINGNEYLAIDMSISFGGTTFEYGNNIHHILLKVSPDPTNPLNSSPIMSSNNWTFDYVFSSMVPGFNNSKFSDVILLSTQGSSVLTFNNPLTNQVNDINRKGWFTHGSFYSQDKTYNALTMVVQSSFNVSPTPVIISGTTQSSMGMDFSIPTGYFTDPQVNDGSFQILQQPYWQKDKIALNIRNSGFTFNDAAGTTATIPTGNEFKEISFNNLWAGNVTSNNGNATFTSKTLGTIQTTEKGLYNAIHISKDEKGEDVVTMIYTSTNSNLIINPNIDNVINNDGQSQLRIISLKNNTPIWNTKAIKTSTTPLNANNVFTFLDVKNLTPAFIEFIKNAKIFGDYLSNLNNYWILPLVIKGEPTWNANGTELTVNLWFSNYYENGVLKTFNEATSPTASVKIINLKVTTLDVSKTNLSNINFSGNTKNITITGEDQALVSASGDAALNQLVKDNVEILYNFDKLSAGTWYTQADFKVALSTSKINFFKDDITNIKIKYSIKAGSIYTVSDSSEQVVVPTQVANVIPFIHMDTYYNDLVRVGASADGIEVTGINTANITTIVWPFPINTEFNKILVAGIKFQWTTKQNPTNASDWKDYNFSGQNPMNIGWNPPYLAVRIVAGNNDVTFDTTNFGGVVEVTPKKIKIKLDLTTNDLTKVIFSGNTKNLSILTSSMTEYLQFESIVDLEFSIGWNFETNTVEDTENTWFNKVNLMNKLRSEETWMIIAKTGFPADFQTNFKLKSRFKVKPGTPNASRYVFNTAGDTVMTYDYPSDSVSIANIKNYLDLNAPLPSTSGTFKMIDVLKNGTIKFGNKDSLVNITEVNLPNEITLALKSYLNTIGITLKYAFGSANTPPNPGDFTTDWNTNFTTSPQSLPITNPALYLMFVVTSSTTEIAPTNGETIKKVEPQIVIPNFIDLDANNLSNVKLSGNSFNNFLIDETLALVGKTPAGTPLVIQHIEIQYNINNIAFDAASTSKIWFTKAELATILPAYTQNIYTEDLNNIKARYSIKPASQIQGVTIAPDLAEVALSAASVKSYLHVKEYYDKLTTDKVTVTGNSANIGQITFPWDIADPTFVKVLAHGIEFQWTTKQSPAGGDWTAYNFAGTTGNPTDIGFPPFLGFRIVVKTAFETTTEIDPAVNNLVDVTPTDIKILINLTGTDLQKIVFSGDTQNLVIDESAMTNFDTYKTIVDVQYSIGWDFTTNTAKEMWYSKTDIINQLKNANTWIILKKAGFPAAFESNFKLKAQFVIKAGIPNENNYVFDDRNSTNVLHTYTETETTNIKNFVNLNATTPISIDVVKILTDGVIKFGEKDSFGNITKVILPTEITAPLQGYLNTLNVELQFAFGSIGTPPADTDFITNWNSNLEANPQGFTSPTPALYLRFALTAAGATTTVIPTINPIEKSGDKLLLPKFIQLSNANLDNLVFSGSTIALNINEDAALVSTEVGQGPTELVKQNIEVVYNINDRTFDPSRPTEVWFTKLELNNLLPTYQENIFVEDLDALKAQYRIKKGADPSITIDTASLPPRPIGILTLSVQTYLHVKSYYDALSGLTNGISVTGPNTSDIGHITFPFDITSINFKKILVAGIEFQWTTNLPDPTTPSTWNKYDFDNVATHPKNIGWNPPYLAFRITVNPANPRTTIDNGIKEKEIDVTPKNIKILINLSEANLQQIVFGGSTKVLTIDESGITNFASFSSVVELQFSVGWDLDKNIATDPAAEIWYSKADLIAKLDTLAKSLFIKRDGYPAELPDTFKLQSRFIIKSGITNETRFIFENNSNEVKHTYTVAEKGTIKNYINISALQTKLETAKITFGPQDKPNEVSELNIATVSTQDKELLKILGIQLEFAFNSATAPDAAAYTKNWNDPFGTPVDPGQPPTVWLKFTVLSSSTAITEIFDSTWTHKAVEPQLEKPKFILLNEINLKNTVLSGSTISLGIDEALSLVPGGAENTQEEVTANIEIIYNINELKLDVNDATKVWFTKAELATLLPTYPNNIFLTDLTNIKSDYRVKPTSADNGWRIPVITPQLVSALNVNSFIHTEAYFNILKDKRVTIEGSATNITNVIFPTDFDKAAFKTLQANGITLQWTTVKTSPVDANWTDLILDDVTTYPKNIGVNPYLGMRIITNNSRVITSDTVNGVVIDVTPLNIKVVYDVNSQILANNLIPAGNTKKIMDLDETASLGEYPEYTNLEIQYRMGGATTPIEFVPGQEWYSFTELKAHLLAYTQLIPPSQKQIKARYALKAGTPLPTPTPPSTPYIGYEINYLGGITEATLDMTNFKSFVDVTQALANLNKNETTFAPGDSTEKITAIIKTGLTAEEAALLFGINFNLKGQLATDLNAPDFSTYSWQPNVNNNLPPRLPNKDASGKPVLMWRFSLTTITDITFNADDNTVVVSDATQLNVSLPIQIVIKTTDYDTIKAAIGGNTKNLELAEAIDAAAITAVKTREKIPAEVPLQILYAIGGGTSLEGLPIDETNPTKTWFTLTEFKTLLAAKTVDFSTNQIRAKFFIDPAYSLAGQQYILSTEAPETLQSEDFTDAAKVKVFINKANYETLPTEITIVGSSDDLTITVPNGLKPSPTGTISPGLELVWSIKANPLLTDIAQTNNDIWTSVVPTMIDPVLKKLSVAYRVKPGYFLEQSANKIYAIDTSKIFVYINVENAWLDQILFTGNLFEAVIDETTFNANLATLPGGSSVQIQYTVDEREWLLKDTFIAKLKQLKGSLDQNNFILLKQKVKARYSIDPAKFEEFRLKVDGVAIIDKPFVENPALFKPILTAPVNAGFNGYINLSKVPDFDTNGFRITGTNTIPILEFTSLGEKLKAQFAPYQDQAISPFDIYYTVDKGPTGTGNFVLDDNHKLFGATGFKTTGFDPVSSNVADQFFGIKIVARNGYQIFKNGIEQVGGWSFNIPLSIKTIKDNPFGTAKLVVKFEGYQGLGKTNLWFDGKTPSELASTVIDRDPDLINQYYVEFHISNTLLTEEELNKLPEESWIKVGAPDGQGGTIQLPSNLKVGQFVAGRIRMKENSTFEIKDIKLNDSLSTKVVNLMINQSEIVINAPQLRNNEYSNQLDLIDGDIYINRINVEPDNKDNYLGVGLVLEVKTEFYTRADGTFITDNNGLPIVKRIPTAYYDVFGTVTGSPASEVRIYYTDATKTMPSDPLEIGTQTNLDLTEVPDSLATFIYNLNSGIPNAKLGLLFQNQTFTIKIKAKQDFVLDTSVPKPFTEKITTAKYPLNINNNVVMSLLIPDPIKYETAGEATPQNGKAFITSDTDIQIQFIEDNGNISNTLKGEAAYTRLVKESNGKLRIKVTLKRKSTEDNFFYNGTDLNLSQLQDLSNGDRVLISLVPIDPNFVLIGPSSSIASWIVNQLEIAAPNTDIFKDLKIVTNVNGSDSIWDGQGTFFVAVKTGSGNPPEDLSDELLNPNDAVPGQTKFHFVYRVWDINKKVRVDWTPDKTRISSLKNGEKVEWRLKSQSGEPL
ncbi:MAG: hypothetical protein ACRDAW_01390, partial [Metamycoplasmataceae bacterium]